MGFLGTFFETDQSVTPGHSPLQTIQHFWVVGVRFLARHFEPLYMYIPCYLPGTPLKKKCTKPNVITSSHHHFMSCFQASSGRFMAIMALALPPIRSTMSVDFKNPPGGAAVEDEGLADNWAIFQGEHKDFLFWDL